jgi:integrase
MMFKDVLDNYRIFLDKMLKDGNYRQETHTAYISYCRNIEEFNAKSPVPITYIYQFDKDFCVRLLEEIYITRDNTPFTRDNYLGFLRAFSSYCLNRNFLKTNPVEGISNLARRSKKKIRTTILNHDLERIYTYIADKNKHYLLACYLLYYCFIRPTEMSKLT